MTQTPKGRKKHLVQGEVSKIEKGVSIGTEKVGEKEGLFSGLLKSLFRKAEKEELEVKDEENDTEQKN